MDKIKLIPFSHFKKKALADPELKKAYDDLELEFSIIQQVIRKRIEKGMTQKQLAQKMGTKQSAISRFERGSVNSSVAFLDKVARALGGKLQVSI